MKVAGKCAVPFADVGTAKIEGACVFDGHMGQLSSSEVPHPIVPDTTNVNIDYFVDAYTTAGERSPGGDVPEQPLGSSGQMTAPNRGCLD